MAREAKRVRHRTALGDFLRGVILALVTLLAPALISTGLTLFVVGWGLWPIALSLAGALGLGFVIPSISNMREESRWVSLHGSSRDRCVHCRQTIGVAAFIAAPPPHKGLIHSGCYGRMFAKRVPA